MWFLKSWEETGGQAGKESEAKMLIQHTHEQAATEANEKMVSDFAPDFAPKNVERCAMMLAGYRSSAHSC